MPDQTAWEYRMAARKAPPCVTCAQLRGDPMPSGVLYCYGQMTWRFPNERIPNCHYRQSKETCDG